MTGVDEEDAVALGRESVIAVLPLKPAVLGYFMQIFLQKIAIKDRVCKH